MERRDWVSLFDRQVHRSAGMVESLCLKVKRAKNYYYYVTTGVTEAAACCLTVWRRNIASSLSHMVGALILMSAVPSLLESNKNTTSSIVREFSFRSLSTSNLGVCNSSIFL